MDKIEVKTPAGLIIAEKNGDPGAPGISMYFIPSGHDVEIDLAIAEVKVNPEYRHTDETEKDVHLYVYGNYSRDEYTDEYHYPREGIMDVLDFS